MNNRFIITLIFFICILLIMLSACANQSTHSSNETITTIKEGSSSISETTVSEIEDIITKSEPQIKQEADMGTLIYGNTSETKSYYPRVVKLINGDLLATFMRADPTSQGWVGMKSYYFYKSSDKGKTWSFLSEMNPGDFGLPVDMQGYQALFVIPQQMGDYLKGTVLLAVTNWYPAYDVMHLWRSTDNGLTWEKHSSFVPRTGTSNKMDAWEPEFTVSSDGRLVCFYADERQEGYNQCIAREISDDGGINWEDYAIIVGKNDSFWRPGMPRVTRLKNGQYFLIYENVNSDLQSSVRFKISKDGIHWDDPTELGNLVGISITNYSAACPELGYIDDGSPYGCIFVRGMEDKCLPTKLYTSIDKGETWTETNAPMTVAGSLSTKAGYSGTLLALSNELLLEINTIYNGTFNEIKTRILELRGEKGK